MELIGLLAIGIVVGIPVIAIVALVRSRAAERRIEESWCKISDLQGEIDGLRREFAKLSDRVNELEASVVPPLAEDRQVSQNPVPVEAAIAPAVAPESKVSPEQSAEPAAASSWLDQTTVPPCSSPEAASTPVTSFEAYEQPAPAGIAALEAHVQPEIVRETEVSPTWSVPTNPRSAIPQTPADPLSPRIPSFAAYEPTPPRESVFQRLKTHLPLEQFLGMNLFAKVGIVLLVLGLALLGRIALIVMGPGPRVALTCGISAAMLGGDSLLSISQRT
jgi:hypothetical protein